MKTKPIRKRPVKYTREDIAPIAALFFRHAELLEMGLAS
jgi:hypothetical protein